MYEVPSQQGRLAVITGANSGTGKEAARRLAVAGARVVLAVRTPSKGEEARAEILARHPGAQVEVRALDLADLASVRAFAAALLADEEGLDLLVNNAGVMTPPTRQTTADGHELQWGTNFLGPFLLTNLLLPALVHRPGARVATMTSSAAFGGRIDFDDLDSERRYAPMRAYAQSKLADYVLGTHLAQLSAERGWGVLSTLAHPGYTRTNLQTSGPNMGTSRTERPWSSRLLPSMGVEQGTESLLLAATDPTAGQADFYGPKFLLLGDAHRLRAPRAARRVDAARLWSAAAQQTGLTADALPPRR